MKYLNMRAVVALALIATMPAVECAAADLLASAVKAVENEASEQSQRPAARGRNPYQTPAIVLFGVGGGLTVLSFLNPSVRCEEGSRFLECGTTANKGLLFSGLGAVALGAYLYMKGDQKRSPSIAVVPGGIVVGHRVRF